MKISPPLPRPPARPRGCIEPLEDRIAPADVDITLVNNTLTIADINAGNLDNLITISGGAGGLPFSINDPNSVLSAAGISTAVLSADQHTVTIPTSTVGAAAITVTSGNGDDTLTLDYTAGAFANFVTFFGGNNVLVGDKLVIQGGTTSSSSLDFTGQDSGGIAMSDAGLVTYTLTEAVEFNRAIDFLSLRYRAASQTITISGGGGLKTNVDSTSGAPVTFTPPTTQVLISGDGDEIFNLNSVSTNYPSGIVLSGQVGSDVINVAAGLSLIPKLTLQANTISSLPALNIGAGGLALTTIGSINFGGDLKVDGLLDINAGGAINDPLAVVKAQSVSALGQGGITLKLDGGAISATTGSVNGVTLSSMNNAPSLLQLSGGLGTATLASGSFLLGKSNAIDGAGSLSVGGTLDLNGFDQGLAFLSGAGVITNTAAALSTFSLGSDASFNFGGTLQGHLALEKVGTATLTLSGTDNAADGTTVRNGTLVFGAAGSAVGGSITLAGGTLAYGVGGTFGSDLTITADSSIEVAMGDVLTLTDLITGPGGLTKTGAGKLILANELNSFGPAKVRITGGILQVATDGALGDVDNDVEINSATFAATAGFASGRNFSNTGGTATLDAQMPNLTLINKAVVQGDLTPTVPANLKFAFVYADNTAVPQKTIVVGDTSVALAGGGTLTIHKSSLTTIDTIELTGTDSTTKLVINALNNQTVLVKRILIDDPNPGTTPADIASIGSITLGKNVQLGDELRDSVADLYVEGKVGKLSLYDLKQYVLLRLGDGLLYDVPGEKKTPDTYSNKPDLKIHDVLGPGVLVDLTPSDLKDNLNRPIGGGGLGKVEVNSWAGSQADPGFIRTTQSLSSFKLLHGDCFVVFHIDKFHVGSGTTATVGGMTIPGGNWGGSGSEIEGGVGSFNALGFLAGATLTAASMGKFGIGAGGFAGLLRLTDPDAAGIPTFTVNSDFTGSVDSESPLRKIKVNGEFMGSLEAPFIGAITAYGFTGSGGAGYAINATDGSLGTLTATAGTVKNFSIFTDQAFKGFNIKLSKLGSSTVGIENMHIEAASIGNISVSLAALAGEVGVNLTGVKDSEFITTGNGADKFTAGNLGNVTITLTGVADGGNATGIENSTFDALASGSTVNTLGKIAVKVTGQDGASLGLKNASFAANTIGAVAVSVSKGKALTATAHAIEDADFTATGTIGTVTVDGDATSNQVHLLRMSAGGNLGAVTVKAKALSFGTLDASAILAGQNLSLSGSATEVLAALAKANLGAVNVTGSILNSKLVAGSAIGAVTVGKDLTGSLLLAGAQLGTDFAVGGSFDAADTYQRAASIAAITVKGAFGTTSIAAGVKPGNTIFGDAGDLAADPAGVLTKTSFIGPITLAGSGPASGAAFGAHAFAIEAATIKSLKLGAITLPPIVNALYLDTALPVGESANDVLVQIV